MNHGPKLPVDDEPDGVTLVNDDMPDPDGWDEE